MKHCQLDLFDVAQATVSVIESQPDTPSSSLFRASPYFTSTVSKEERKCYVNARVRIYRNLNKREFYSIKAMDGENKGKVIGYAKCVVLKDVKFVVGAKSRETVVKNNRRNVHAYCEGIIVDAFDMLQTLGGYQHVVTYNPFKQETFYIRETGKSFMEQCSKVILQGADVHVY